MKTTKNEGHGVLEEIIKTFETDVELGEYLNNNSQSLHLNEYLDKLLIDVDKRLEQLELPISYGKVHKKGNGSWEYFDRSKLKENDRPKWELGLKYITTKYKPFSEEWVMAKINFSVWEIKFHLNKESPDMSKIAMMMYYLGLDSGVYDFNLKQGEDASRGYLNRQQLEKAGIKGSQANKKALRERHLLFIETLSKIIRENPILRDDPPEDTAFRALKYARKNAPEKFRRASSKKTAIQYWEYIKSDKELREIYENKLILPI